MKHLDLFSGIGGFALAARNVGWQTVAFCESDEFCQSVLRKHWPDVPIHPDVRTLSADAVGSVDIITGGYPCQPFSLAGRRAGANDDRHLWPAMYRVVNELRPSWVLGENVAGHITLGLDDVLSDLEGLGYSWETFVIPAVAVDAKHRRERLWIVGHSAQLQRNGSEHHAGGNSEAGTAFPEFGDSSSSTAMADFTRNESGRTEQWPERERARESGESVALEYAAVAGLEGWDKPEASRQAQRQRCRTSGSVDSGCAWLPEPDVGRVAHGVPRRVDRLRSLGNAIVPQVAEEIFRAIAAVNQ